MRGPAAVQIIDYLFDLLERAEVADSVVRGETDPQELEDRTRANVLLRGDDAFPELSVLGAEGRALEIDIRIGCRGDGRESAAEGAKAVSAAVEAVLSANDGVHVVGVVPVLAERVGDLVEAESDEQHHDVALLDLQYTILHRIAPGEPNTLVR